MIRIFVFFALGALVGCSHDPTSAAPNGAPSDAGLPSDADAPLDAGSPPAALSPDALAAWGPCVVSLDCPVGSHCDLGTCVQDCNADHLCQNGDVCGARARCVEAGTADVDTIPDAGFGGTLAVTPDSVTLTPTSRSLMVHVAVAGTTQDVPYRVELQGPHLSVAADRGKIHGGSQDIAVAVDPSKVTGARSDGWVKVITSIGTGQVAAPIEIGMTGAYHGVLLYDDPNGIALGSFPFVLAMSASGGQVVASMDPTRSVTMVDAQYGAARGGGSRAASGAVELTLTERAASAWQAAASGVGSDWNAARAPFTSRGLRTIALHLAPSAAADGFDGTFNETDDGLLSKPVVIHGHVSLVRAAGIAGLVPSSAAEPATPAPPQAGAFLEPDVAWTDPESTCAALVCFGGTCPTDAPTVVNDVRNVEDRFGLVYYPYLGSLSDPSMPNVTFDAIANACESSVLAPSLAPSSGCGNVTPLGCALGVAARVTAPTAETYLAFQRLVTEIANPALTAARNHLALAAVASLTTPPAGSSADLERQHYVSALRVLDVALRWVLQPAVLDFLRDTPDTMRGDHAFQVTFAPAGSATPVYAPFDSYPAARSVQALLYLRGLASLELVRAGAVHPSASVGLDAAQRLSLVTFLDGVAFGTVLNAWGLADSAFGSTVEGLVQPGVRMTTKILSGANAFGLPAGYVPFVYDPTEISAQSNFLQVLNAAEPDMTQLGQTAMSVEDARSALKSQTVALQTAKLSITTDYDNALHAACGTDFNLDATPIDWTRCGVNGGSVLALHQEYDAAVANQTSAMGLVMADGQKIIIAANTLTANQALDSSLIRFTDANGNALAVIDFVSGSLDAAEQALQIGGQAGFLAPAAGAAAVGVFAAGEVKAALAAGRTRLQTVETLQNLQTSMQKEFNDGMANIKSMMVDMAQHEIEVESKTVAVTQANTDLVNAIANAKVVGQTRAQAQALLRVIADPTALLMRDRSAVDYLNARTAAQASLYKATLALLYEVNLPQPDDQIVDAVSAANSPSKLGKLRVCLTDVYNAHRAYGAPVEYTTEISARKQLHVSGDVVDPATGQTISAGARFRQIILAQSNIEGDGTVRFSFPTNLLPDNGLWSTDICEDRITNVEAKLVGDGLGDNFVQVDLQLSGTNFLRSCQPGDPLRAWDLGGLAAAPFDVIQGGVNTYGASDPVPEVNMYLFGQSVARATWTLEIPTSGRAPANADVKFANIDDVVLRIRHKGIPIQLPGGAPPVDTSCVFNAGN